MEEFPLEKADYMRDVGIALIKEHLKVPDQNSVRCIGGSVDSSHLNKFIQNMVRSCQRPAVLLKTKKVNSMNMECMRLKSDHSKFEVSSHM